MTSDFQVTPGEHPAVAITRLRRQGLTVKQAASIAGLSERHAYRVLNQLEDRPLTFERWSPSLAREHDSAEKVEWLFETSIDGGWWTDDADIAWALHCADGELEPHIIKAFCRLYLAARYGDPGLASQHRMIIDRALWHRIWEGNEEVRAFVDGLPVFSSQELDYAAEVASYLPRYHDTPSGPADGPALSIRTVVEGVDDRNAYFALAVERAADAEQQRLIAAPPGVMVTAAVPEEKERRERRARRSKTED